MAFTYTGDLSDPLQYVRFKITDTDPDAPVYMDEEINYFISKYTNPTETDLNKVAATLLENWIKKILSAPSRERSGSYEVYSQSAQGLKLLLTEIKEEVRKASPAKPYFGGVIRSEVESLRDNDKFIQSTFYKGRIYPRNEYEEVGEDDTDFF